MGPCYFTKYLLNWEVVIVIDHGQCEVARVIVEGSEARNGCAY